MSKAIPAWILLALIFASLELGSTAIHRFSIIWIGETFGVLALLFLLFLIVQWMFSRPPQGK